MHNLVTRNGKIFWIGILGLAFSLIIAGRLSILNPEPADPKGNIQDSDALHQQGIKLRADLEKMYKGMATVPALPLDITETVQEHIPVGISFDVAEAILRGAGFTVSPRKVFSTPGGLSSWSGVAAQVDLAGDFTCKVRVHVSLYSETLEDYRIVHEVQANIQHLCL